MRLLLPICDELQPFIQEAALALWLPFSPLCFWVVLVSRETHTGTTILVQFLVGFTSENGCS